MLVRAGLQRYDGWTLQLWNSALSLWQNIDQSFRGNDFWQTIFDQNTLSYTLSFVVPNTDFQRYRLINLVVFRINFWVTLPGFLGSLRRESYEVPPTQNVSAMVDVLAVTTRVQDQQVFLPSAVTFSLTQGTLPPGIVLPSSASVGVFTGTLLWGITASQDCLNNFWYNFTVRASATMLNTTTTISVDREFAILVSYGTVLYNKVIDALNAPTNNAVYSWPVPSALLFNIVAVVLVGGGGAGGQRHGGGGGG